MFGTLACGVAQAAMLNTIKGQVLVDLGQGYQAVSAAADLPIGSRIMLPPEAQARIFYPDGCVRVLAAGDIAVVSAQSPCLVEAQGARPIVTGQIPAAAQAGRGQAGWGQPGPAMLGGPGNVQMHANEQHEQQGEHGEQGSQPAPSQTVTPSPGPTSVLSTAVNPIYVVGGIAVAAGGGLLIKKALDAKKSP